MYQAMITSLKMEATRKTAHETKRDEMEINVSHLNAVTHESFSLTFTAAISALLMHPMSWIWVIYVRSNYFSTVFLWTRTTYNELWQQHSTQNDCHLRHLKNNFECSSLFMPLKVFGGCFDLLRVRVCVCERCRKGAWWLKLNNELNEWRINEWH